MERDMIEDLKRIYMDQKAAFEAKKNLTDREIDLTKYLSTNQVVVISGARRCGKSSLLAIIKNKLSLQEAEYCYFNFDDERIIAGVSVFEDIYALHLELYKQEPVFFFDEIQVVKGWEKFVNRMHESGRKFFITGSNALLLSSEISSLLSGRNKTIELYPFSFSEYLSFIGHSYNLDRLTTKSSSLLNSDYNTYIEYGGFPLVVKEKDLELIDSWFQDIIYKDILVRFNLTHVNEVRQVALYLISNIGKLFSYSTLKNISDIKSASTVKDYLQYFSMSYLFYYLPKFDFSIKKQILNPKKVYTVDNAVATRMGFNFSENRGRYLENLVFLELKRRGKEVYYYKEKKECDFIVKEHLNLLEAIQVTVSLHTENFGREHGGLTEAMLRLGINKGTIIVENVDKNCTMNPDPRVTVVPVCQWLLAK